MDSDHYMVTNSIFAAVFIGIVLLVISAFLNMSEKSISSVSKAEIKQRAKDGDKQAKRIAKLLEKPYNYIYASRVLMVVLTVAIATLVFKAACACLASYTATVSPWLFWAVLIASVIVLGALITIFAVIIPGQIAMKEPVKIACGTSMFAMIVSVVMRPAVFISRMVSALILKIFGQKPFAYEEKFSEEEVISMLTVGTENESIKEEGKKMIESIFAFDDKLAYEIMTPRTDVFSIDICDEKKTYLDELLRMRYSRVPVYEEDTDNIIGILNIKDFLIMARRYGFENVDIRAILRSAFFIPETKNIDSLLVELQKKKQQIAILIDEYGGFSGIVTMEDIIEEVVGEIDDEYDVDAQEIKKINFNTYYVNGNVDLDDLNEQVGSDLYSDTSETIAGLMLEHLGEIPDERSYLEVRIGRYVLNTAKVKDQRIEKVRMTILDEETGELKDKKNK